MKNYYLLLLLLLATSFSSVAQTTLYSENFTGQNGVGYVFPAGTTGLGTVNWTIDLNGSEPDFFNVTNEQFISQYTFNNEFPRWISPSINIAGYINVTLSLAAFTSNNMQATDTFRVEYRINGGTWVAPASLYRTDDFNATLSLGGLSGNTLQIRVTNTNDSGERHTFDNVLVVGTPPCTPPSTQASAYNTTNINSPSVGNATLNWTRGNGNNVLVVMRAGGAVNADPVIGTAYTANATFGSGQQIGTGNYVVYNGPANLVNVNGLSPTSTYHVAVYEYNNTSTCYNTTELTGNFLVPCAAYGLPFNEGFSGTTFPPACWATYIGANGVGTGFNWGRTTTTGEFRTGPGAATVRYENVTGTNTNPAEDWLVTPAIDLTQTTSNTLKFWARDAGFGDNSTYTVRVSTTSQTNRNSFSIIPSATITAYGTTYLEQTVNLSAYDGQTVYIAFVMTNDDGDNWYIDDISVTGTTPPVTYVYDNGWSPSDPNGVSTTLNTIIIANGDAVISSNTSANSVVVSSTASLTVNTGQTFTVLNEVNMDSNAINYSSLIVNGTLSGTVNYNRHVNGQNTVGVGTGNDLISAPVSGQTFAAFALVNEDNLRSNPNNANQKLFGPFSKTTGTYLLWDVTVNGGTTLDAGVGYRAASTDNGGFTFTGTVNSGVVTHNIVNSGPQFAPYNLIGNPYPSYINVREFLEYDVDPSGTTVRNIDLMSTNNAAIYGYDGDAAGLGGDGWVVYNLTTPNTVNMAPGQGFLVTSDAADVAAFDMTFTPSMRRIGTTDDFIPGRMASENSAHIKLQASVGDANFKTDLFFMDNATSGLDFGYDAGVFGSNAAAKSIYSHLVQQNTGVDMAIQAMAYSDLGSDITIPLGINVPQGQQVTVSIAESDLPDNIEVYLEDNVTGTFTLLNTGDYTFTPNTNLTDTGRFYVRFADATLSTPDALLNGLEIYTTTAPRALFIKGQLTEATNVQLYDVQGRVVLNTVLDSTSTNNQVDVSNLSAGVYIVKLGNTAQQKTQKVILK